MTVQAAELLTWKGCVQEAMQHNSKLKAAQQTYDAYRYAEFGSYRNFFPQLNGTLSYNYGTSSTAIGSGGSISTVVGGAATVTPPASSNFTGTLSLTQNLFNGFSDQGTLEQARAQRKAYQAAVDQAKAQVLSDLKNAYGTLLIAQRQVLLQEEITNRRQRNLDLVTLQFNSGKENKGSVLLSRAYLNQARYNALLAVDNQTTSRAQLALVLGRDEPGDYTLSDDIPWVTLQKQVDFVQLALTTPNYNQAVAQEEANQAVVKISQAGFFPSLNASASVSQFGQEFFPQGNRWFLGINLNFPLFNGGQYFYQTKSARENFHAAGSTRKNLGRQLVSTLKQAYVSYLEAVSQLKMNESFREAGVKRSEIATGKYNNGLMSFEDWDIIENARITYETSVLQSQLNLIITEAAWMLAQGKGAAE